MSFEDILEKVNQITDKKDFLSLLDKVSDEYYNSSSTSIKDAEFELFNVNGFHNQRILVPGSTSLDYKFAIKLDTSDIKKWTKDLTEVKLKDYDDEWTKQIIKNRKQNWRTKSKPQYFTRKGANVTVLVFKNEGILFKRVSDL
jgi:hypothetical protein